MGWRNGALFVVLLLSFFVLGCGKTSTEDGEGEDTETRAGIRPDMQKLRERLEGQAPEQGEDGEAAEEESSHEPMTLPFDLQLEELTLGDDAPGLHSFAAAVVEEGPNQGKWLMLGGRTNGLHNLVGHSFPTSERNDRIWVVDPAGGATCSSPLDGLLVDLADALAATNHQAVQVGDVLWVNGGYGWSVNAQDNVTFGYLIAVDVPGLVAAVVEHCGAEIPQIGQHFSHGSLEGEQGEDCRRFGPGTTDGPLCDVTLTGGGIQRVGDELFLGFGQHFGGRYNDFRNQQQIYACQVVRFAIPTPAWGETFELAAPTLVAAGGAGCPPGGLRPNNDPFHRRDLNLLPTAYLEEGQPAEGVVALGGVFKDEFFAYDEPIWVTAAGATVDTANHQKMGQYEAANLTLFSESADALHSVILGGISSHYCKAGESGVETPQCTKVRKIWSFPGFVEDGIVLTCQGPHRDGADFTCGGWSQTFLYQPFKVSNPGLPTGMLGSNTQFFPALDVAAYSNGVIRLDELPTGEYTRVGTFYGGIEVSGKVPGQPFLHDKTKSETQASQRAFAVRVRPR